MNSSERRMQVEGYFLSRELFLLVLILMLGLIANTYSAIPISSINQLQLIGNDPNYPLNGEYELVNNIDASVTQTWNGGAGFNPIGLSTYFTGKFNGNGYKITNLYINRGGQQHCGLFGYVGTGGEVRNLRLEGISITGGNSTGGLVGENYGLIYQCCVEGSVTSPNRVGVLVAVNYGSITQCFSKGSATASSVVGGLVGENRGTVSQCYSWASANGTSQRIGGLVGTNYSTITECYSIGTATGGNNVGGLVGYNSGGTVTKSYWDTQTSGLTYSAGGTGKTTAEMKQQATFVNWDFTNVWLIEESVTYPYFIWETYSPSEGEGTTEGVVEGTTEGTTEGEGVVEGEGILEGSTEGEGIVEGITEGEGIVEGTVEGSIEGEGIVEGTVEGSIEGEGIVEGTVEGSIEGEGAVEGEGELTLIYISSIEDLQKIGSDPNFPLNGNYVLTQDLDANDTQNWNGGNGFIPIGSVDNPFTGTFNGNGHTISNLYINNSSGEPTGLFSVVGSGAVISQIGIENAQISGGNEVGSIAGANYGIISQCYVTGEVSGIDNVGGLVGNNSGTVIDCYSKANVDGNNNVGSLIGYNAGDVINSYSNGTVTGSGNIGGLIGGASGGNVVASYWDVETSGLNISAGGEGRTTEEMHHQITYLNWDFETVWGIVEGSDYPYLLWQGPPATEGEGMSEGITEGEGTIEGVVEGEGVPEGVVEGEGVPEGEGTPENTIIPNVIGLPPNEAISALESAGLIVGATAYQCSDNIPAGVVMSVSPPPGEVVPVGTTVMIYVSTGPCSHLTAWIDAPSEVTRPVGGVLELNVGVQGSQGEVFYQWYFATKSDPNTPIPILGAIDPTLRLYDLQLENAGWYWCEVMDDLDVTETPRVKLNVVYTGLSITSPIALFTALTIIVVTSLYCLRTRKSQK